MVHVKGELSTLSGMMEMPDHYFIDEGDDEGEEEEEKKEEEEEEENEKYIPLRKELLDNKNFLITVLFDIGRY